LAEAWGAVLIVHRWWKSDHRALVMNLGQRQVSLDSVVERLELRRATTLLESSPCPGGVLGPGDAIVFGGARNRARSIEGAT
jgi:hypothetical protein